MNSNPNNKLGNSNINSKFNNKTDPSDLTVIPNWVYGIRFKDVKYFI